MLWLTDNQSCTLSWQAGQVGCGLCSTQVYEGGMCATKMENVAEG